eukprot:6205010-Pleurochrysis_carterae.AAC.2
MSAEPPGLKPQCALIRMLLCLGRAQTALNTELQIQAGVQEVGAGLRAALGHYQQAMVIHAQPQAHELPAMNRP